MENSKNIVCKVCGSVNKLPNRDLKKANCGKCKNSLLDTTPAKLSENSFDNYIVNTSVPVVVDFWAPWCGPCKMMAPVFEEIAKEFPLKVQFAKVNTEEEQSLGGKYAIRSIPTLVIYRDGKEIERQSGALDAIRLKQWLMRYSS